LIDASEFQYLAADIGAEISAKGAGMLLAYLDAMLEENRVVNLTAVRDREAAIMFHALDSISMAVCPFETPPKMALDIGTGNGFPGIAIACLFPETEVLLIDRTLKKLKAIERAFTYVGFDPERLKVMQLDAAEGPSKDLGKKFDLITARAVGGPHEIGKMSAPLLAPEGRLLTWLGAETEAPTTLKGGLRLVGELEYYLPNPADRVRHLADYKE
jgi:16S rRNA (guanine527-N7)-methyltransferase